MSLQAPLARCHVDTLSVHPYAKILSGAAAPEAVLA